MVPENPTTVYLLGAAVVALFGMLTKLMQIIIQRADKGVDDANKRTGDATGLLEAERKRYDLLLEKGVAVSERIDENVDGLFRILDGTLRYMRERMESEKPDVEPPPIVPPSERPKRTGGAR